MAYLEAGIIGLCQTLALAGISRSGVTIVAGLPRGLDQENAAKISFLLATPVILAAGLLKLPSLAGPTAATIHGPILAGAAAVAAHVSVRFLTRYFTTRTLARSPSTASSSELVASSGSPPSAPDPTMAASVGSRGLCPDTRPKVPGADLGPSDTKNMADPNVVGVVVKSPAGLAQPGDVVLPGPAALQVAMVATYGARGGAFKVPVRRGPDDQRGR